MGVIRPRKLSTLMRELRASRVSEYEGDGIRLVFDYTAPPVAPVPDAKKKPAPFEPNRAARIALHGFPPNLDVKG